MNPHSATQTIRGRLVTGREILPDGYVTVADGRILDVGPVEPGSASADRPVLPGMILPGLVDIHCHGGGGASMTSGRSDEVVAAARHHHRFGTTAVVASVVTDRPDRMLAAVDAAAEAVAAGGVEAIHIEGPFLAAARCGAQDPRHLAAPDEGLARDLVAAGRGHVRVMTLAPELAGADLVTDLLGGLGVMVAVGHTDAGNLATAKALSRLGTDLVTHLFNGMPSFHHREPGPSAAALVAAVRGDVRVELVADGVHLADATARMVFELVGPEQVVLVTDAMAAAGMSDGTYDLGPQRVTVREGVARLAGEGDRSIAGGTSRLIEIVQRCVQHAGVDLLSAVRAATVTPAAALGLTESVGEIAAGRRADLVHVGSDLSVERVMRSGRWDR